MSRIFLDTNFLIYAIDKNIPSKRIKARRLLRELRRDSRAVLSTQVLQEFYVVVTRKLGVDPLVAKRIVQLLSNFEIVTVTSTLIENAINGSIANQISFWDALIVAAAKSAACKEIWTEDLQHGQVIQGVEIVDSLSTVR